MNGQTTYAYGDVYRRHARRAHALGALPFSPFDVFTRHTSNKRRAPCGRHRRHSVRSRMFRHCWWNWCTDVCGRKAWTDGRWDNSPVPLPPLHPPRAIPGSVVARYMPFHCIRGVNLHDIDLFAFPPITGSVALLAAFQRISDVALPVDSQYDIFAQVYQPNLLAGFRPTRQDLPFCPLPATIPTSGLILPYSPVAIHV